MRGVWLIYLKLFQPASLYSINAKVMLQEYSLKVTVRLPIPHVNACVDIPIIIGATRVEKAVEAIEEGKPSVGFVEPNEVDELPSYWEVMCEEKVSDEK